MADDGSGSRAPGAPGAPPAQEPGAASGGVDDDGGGRLITLSDGVVAIALTLLILSIQVPDNLANRDSISALANALYHDTVYGWISYAISFYTIAQFWTIHRRVFRGITAQQGGLAAWNFLFLFTISVMPFTSDLIGKFPENPLAVIIFSANLILANLAIHGVLTLGRRLHLLNGAGDEQLREFRSLQGVLDITFYVIAIPVALVSPDLGKVCWFGLALSSRIAPAITGTRDRGRARRDIR
jgi:uncharacterized membrane protein